jgi:YHS domain-containing protein
LVLKVVGLCSNLQLRKSNFSKAQIIQLKLMKTLFSVAALSFAMAFAASATPENTACPVSGKPVKPGIVSKFQGKEYGLCCAKCKAKFDAEPARFTK